MIRRLCGIALLSMGLVLGSGLPAIAGALCAVDRATSAKLGMLTSQASSSFLEAGSHAFLTFKAYEDGADSFSAHRATALKRLEDASRAYREALSLPDDLQRADTFLRSRPFDRLQAVFGITPGTPNHSRWEIIVRTAQTSKSPAAELLQVCAVGADSLKYTMTTARPDMPAALLRRAVSAWLSVLAHGQLVSDAFDSSAR
jgi:hypothetical protein